MKKQNLNSLDFSTFVAKYNELRERKDFDAIGQQIADFAADNKLKLKEWFIPQALALFAEVKLERNETGLFSSKKLLDEIRKNEQLTGLWLLFKSGIRSGIVEKQNSGDSRNFCALVPLIMSAYKKYKGINYSAWDPSEIAGITDKSLAEVMTSQVPYFSREELLEAREDGLLIKTGLKAGKMRNSVTEYAFYPSKKSSIGEYPKLLQIMLCQVWCAHPINRSEYMILDPNNWDTMPEPLITDDVLDEEIPKFKSKAAKNRYTPPDSNTEIPWDV